MSAITAAGRRREAGLTEMKAAVVEVRANVDDLLGRSAVARHEALTTLAAITRRAEQNHIAEGVALAFERRGR